MDLQRQFQLMYPQPLRISPDGLRVPIGSGNVFDPRPMNCDRNLFQSVFGTLSGIPRRSSPFGKLSVLLNSRPGIHNRLLQSVL